MSINNLMSGVLVGNEKVYGEVRYVGLDVANSYVKIATKDSIPSKFPNTFKILTKKDLKEYSINQEENGEYSTNVEDMLFKYKERNEQGVEIENYYQIGNVSKDVNESLDTSTDRYEKESFKRSFILSLASIAVHGDIFIVCTGLPSSDFLTEKNKNDIKKLEGTHTVNRNEHDVTFLIKYIHVDLQPRGSYFNSAFKIEGDKIVVRDARIKNSKYVGILDGGFGTTDFCAITTEKGKAMKLSNIVGLDIGMADAYKMIQENLYEKYGAIDKMPLLELEKSIREDGEVRVSGKYVDPDELKKEVFNAFETVSQQIMDELRKKVGSLEGYNYILFTGGAMITLREHLAKKIQGPFDTGIPKEPQTANAEGYLVHLYMLEKSGKLEKLIAGGNR